MIRRMLRRLVPDVAFGTAQPDVIPLPDRSISAQSVLREILDYDPETGFLTWKARTPDMFRDGARGGAAAACRAWNNRYSGCRALCAIDSCGYCGGHLLNKSVRAHRIIWAWVHDEWPNQIDHINGDKADNRLANLRPVTNQINLQNASLYSNNTSGSIGVYWYRQTKKWRAQIRVDGRCISLGYFSNFDDAVAARKAAEREYGYHPNHGRIRSYLRST